MASRTLALAALLVVAACGDEGGGSSARRDTSLTPLTHDPYFPIASGAHQGLECNACHGKFDTFLKFDCLDCHKHNRDDTDAIHAGNADYAYDSAKCLSCHPRGSADGSVPADHDLHFPISSGAAHAGVGCTSCHLSASDRTQISCSSGSCHPAAEVTPPHAGVGGFAMESKLCERCHADAQVDRIAKHLPMTIGAGAPHAGTDCLSCHPQLRKDKPFGADFTVKTCVGGPCHPQAATTSQHSAEPDFSWDTQACITCHPDGTKNVHVSHPSFPIDAGSHTGLSCATCHADVTDHANVTCSSGECHASAVVTPQHAHVGGFAVSSKLCLRCHGDSQVFRMAAHGPFDISATGKHFEQACLTCHPQMRLDKPFAADFTQRTCTDASCHPQAVTADRHAGKTTSFRWDTPSCLLCHPTGSAKDAVDHTGFFPIGTGTKHALECTECHTDASDQKVVTCAGSCHTSAAMSTAHTVTATVGGYQYQNALCLRCHSDTSSLAFRVGSHPSIGEQNFNSRRHRSLCLACHQINRTDRPYPAANFARTDCRGSGCHSSAGGPD